jgi:hypothetical protein
MYGPRYSAEEARNAISDARSFSQALRRLGMRSTGHNHRTLRKYADMWEIPTGHFQADPTQSLRLRQPPTPLSKILVEGSTYHRSHLKKRLYEEGLKERRCELCGQGEIWRGRRMSLILDHANGRGDDHRLENLRIVCPNCAATLDTHCGRNVRIRKCCRCGNYFTPNSARQRHCSIDCGRLATRGIARPEIRKAARPAYEQLVLEIRELGYRAVGRRYGVSDNAVRKWVRSYDREIERKAQDEQQAA